MSCFVDKSKKCGTFLSKLSKWNRRFLTFDFEKLKLAYKKNPTSVKETVIPLEVWWCSSCLLIFTEHLQHKAKHFFLEAGDRCGHLLRA